MAPFAYPAAMGSIDVVRVVLGSGAAASNVAVATAIFAKSRHNPHTILWRRSPLHAPRLQAAMHLFIGLGVATGLVGTALFERRSTGHTVMVALTLPILAAAVVMGVMMVRRRVRGSLPAPPP
ncbi:effector-associated constant component EACC1 [Phytohabitans aurantiacus]|uniref:DUF1275 family protein n=1 Tax=Phytohabitans aurantiacus TaxID=3016789 RepID=A0ABQ5QT21_9ACTN|nr:hypothetical protein Pa4123_30230 [Phytohabitans aurantiacus]